jgi:hypothetical protein
LTLKALKISEREGNRLSPGSAHQGSFLGLNSDFNRNSTLFDENYQYIGDFRPKWAAGGWGLTFFCPKFVRWICRIFLETPLK